ncbi:membrane protein YczE [Oryzihumus sp.]
MHRPAPRRLTRRLVQLYAGLVTFALGEAMVVQAHLGILPWDVLHQGLVHQLGLTIGQWSVIVGAVVLLAWLPLRERPGLGTVSNVLVIGFSLDAFIAWLPVAHALPARVLLLLGGILLNGVATAAYIGARLGPGPRDGLMTGLVRRTGGSVRVVRTAIEVAVVVVGWLLGGNLGLGTVLFAVAIGPVVHVFLPRLTVPGGPGPATH